LQIALEEGDFPSQQLEGELSRSLGFDSPKGHDHSVHFVDSICESQLPCFASPIQLDNSTPETLKKNKKVKTTNKRKLVASRRILTMPRKMF